MMSSVPHVKRCGDHEVKNKLCVCCGQKLPDTMTDEKEEYTLVYGGRHTLNLMVERKRQLEDKTGSSFHIVHASERLH